MSDQDDDVKVAGGVVAFAVAIALLAAGGGAITAITQGGAQKPAVTAKASANLESLGPFAIALADGKLTLEGAVPDEGTKGSLLKKAALLFGADNVVDKITVDAAAKALGWKSHALDLLAALKRWGAGSFNFDAGSVKVSAKVASADAKNGILGWLKSLFASSVKLDNAGVEVAADIKSAGGADNVLLSESIEFATGSYDITDKDQARLDAIAEVLKDMGRKVEISGHTDNVGDAAANKQLSQQRAESVKAYLKGRGVGDELLSAKGHGADMPVADNGTDEGRQRNRRIEFVSP